MRRRKLTPEALARGGLARAIERTGQLTPADADRAAAEVARATTMLMVELCGAAWLALKEQAFSDGPMEGAVVGRDDRATELYAAAVDYLAAVLETHAAETEQAQPSWRASALISSQLGPLTSAEAGRHASRRVRRETEISPAVEERWAAHLRRLSWKSSVQTGFEVER